METTTVNNYEQQAADFLNNTGATISIEFARSGKHFADDKDERDIYTVEIKRGGRAYKFEFGNSLADSGFYCTVGRRRFDIDRKYIGHKDLTSVAKEVSGGLFQPHVKADTIHRPVAPSPYSVLACLTKYSPGNFEDFCGDYGHAIDIKKAEKTYNAVVAEYLNMTSLFSESEMELLQEIQ